MNIRDLLMRKESYNRREAKKGSGDEIPRQVLGQQP